MAGATPSGTKDAGAQRQKASNALRNAAERLESRAIGLRAIADALDTSTAASFFGVGSPAESALWDIAYYIR